MHGDIDQIVNIESLRNENNKQFNGYIKIAYDFKKVNEIDWEMENEIFLNWNYKSWTIYLINEINLDRGAGIDFSNDGFQHLRINNKINTNINLFISLFFLFFVLDVDINLQKFRN